MSKYNNSPFGYKRLKTREVMVGEVGVGGNNPIRIQSMTTSDTQNIELTINQVLELERVGCEIVRITVPSLSDAIAMVQIRQKLQSLKSKVPLVADIHFTPRVAMKVVESVDKIRINPGNFADKKKFKVIEYTDKEYDLELERISDTFVPLVQRCKELGVSMRIGTNHGSLSDRIMNRFGDTPLGMCESALEFIKIAESESFYDMIVSMKSSNPQVMIQTYRLLSAKFINLNMNYPFHLGVTEAGYGREGRIKSSVGIGSLLEDGLGDTIRVSLTEDAVNEIPVARWIANKYNQKRETSLDNSFDEFRDPFSYEKFQTKPVFLSDIKLGEDSLVRLEFGFKNLHQDLDNILNFINTGIRRQDNRNIESIHLKVDSTGELDRIRNFLKSIPEKIPVSLEVGSLCKEKDLIQFLESQSIDKIVLHSISKDILFSLNNLSKKPLLEISILEEELNKIPDILSLLAISNYNNIIFSLDGNGDLVTGYRKLFSLIKDRGYPVLLKTNVKDIESGLYETSIGFGGLLIDGIGDIIRIEMENTPDPEWIEIGYDILQASRLRTTKTEFISCPSCGRTLFDLQDTTARIKSKTGHLKGVKIAVMGCIVNGPGEMADADFGYVGAGPGKIHLYKGKEIVKKSIPSEIADGELIALIQENGMWIDP